MMHDAMGSITIREPSSHKAFDERYPRLDPVDNVHILCFLLTKLLDARLSNNGIHARHACTTKTNHTHISISEEPFGRSNHSVPNF